MVDADVDHTGAGRIDQVLRKRLSRGVLGEERDPVGLGECLPGEPPVPLPRREVLEVRGLWYAMRSCWVSTIRRPILLSSVRSRGSTT